MIETEQTGLEDWGDFGLVWVQVIYQKLHCTSGFFGKMQNVRRFSTNWRFLNTKHREGVFRHF